MNEKTIHLNMIRICKECFSTVLDDSLLEVVDFIEDLGMDSVQFISLIIEIEDTFEIVVPDENIQIESFRNFDLCLKIVKRLLGERDCEKAGETSAISNES